MKRIFFQIILPLVGIAGILGFITWFNPITQQQAAFSENPVIRSCGPITLQIDMQQNQACNGSGTIHGLTNYQAGAHFKIISGGGAYAVSWKWGQYFCPNEDPHAPCLTPANNPGGSTTGTGGLTGNQTAQFTAWSADVRPPTPFAACGYYQDDLAFTVKNIATGQIVCSYGNFSNPASSTPVAAWCHSGASCTVPAPSATPTPRPTVTPKPSNTPTPTIAPTCTPLPACFFNHPSCKIAVGINFCPPVPTSTPTPTPTAGPSATPTPTGMPTSTPTPTPTGVVVTATPTPENTNNCDNTTQSGTNDNNNCNQQSQNQTQNQQQDQNNNQTIDNNANNSNTVNITLNGTTGEQQQQQEVLAAATAPTQLPSTGADSDVLFGLLALIPIGWKIRKLI